MRLLIARMNSFETFFKDFEIEIQLFNANDFQFSSEETGGNDFTSVLWIPSFSFSFTHIRKIIIKGRNLFGTLVADFFTKFLITPSQKTKQNLSCFWSILCPLQSQYWQCYYYWSHGDCPLIKYILNGIYET